jgi:hypothetical protein
VNVYQWDATPITDQFGARLAHQVFDTNAAGRTQDARLQTVCGRYITPAPMIGPVGTPCLACTTILDGRHHDHQEEASPRTSCPTPPRRFWPWRRG